MIKIQDNENRLSGQILTIEQCVYIRIETVCGKKLSGAGSEHRAVGFNVKHR